LVPGDDGQSPIVGERIDPETDQLEEEAPATDRAAAPVLPGDGDDNTTEDSETEAEDAATNSGQATELEHN
jgi:hypothetical protein